MNILCILGTRPEIIKLAPVIQGLQRHEEKITSTVCVTGQHREMLNPIMHFFKIKPNYDLNLRQKKQSLTDFAAAILTGLQPIFSDCNPDWVIVQGDTTTAFASALAAFYHQIKVAHVEAGLRTYNLHSPWPEEGNRCLISAIANVHYAPTKEAQDNLLSSNKNKGIKPKNVVLTGNTVIDALLWTTKRIETDVQLQDQLSKQFKFLNSDKRLILVTGHRRENWEKGLAQVFQALKKIAQRNDVEIIYPVHINPIVFNQAKAILQNQPNIYLIDPVDYPAFVYLMQRAYLIVTDSGGVQEEAPSLGKPVLITRDTTERPDAIQVGTAKLVGTDATVIQAEICRLLDDTPSYQKMTTVHHSFGDGHASQYIVEDLLERIDHETNPTKC